MAYVPIRKKKDGELPPKAQAVFYEPDPIGILVGRSPEVSRIFGLKTSNERKQCKVQPRTTNKQQKAANARNNPKAPMKSPSISRSVSQRSGSLKSSRSSSKHSPSKQRSRSFASTASKRPTRSNSFTPASSRNSSFKNGIRSHRPGSRSSHGSRGRTPVTKNMRWKGGKGCKRCGKKHRPRSSDKHASASNRHKPVFRGVSPHNPKR